MKHILLFISLLGIAINAEAQNQSEVMPIGRTWKGVYVDFRSLDGNYTETPFSTTVVGDTIVGDRTLRKLLNVTGEGDNATQYYAYAYEEDGRIYDYSDDEHGRGRFLDVTDEQGHSKWEPWPYFKIYDINYTTKNDDDDERAVYTRVVKEDTICVNGIYRRRLTLDDEPYDERTSCTYWVDGIGTNILYDANFGYPVPTCLVAYNYKYVTECYDNGVLIFSASDFNAPAYNAVNAIDRVECDVKTVPTYDLSGRRVSTLKKNEVYIRGGKKIIK